MTNQELQKTIGTNLRVFLAVNNVSQKSLIEKTKLSRQTVYNVVHGKNHLITLGALNKVAQALEVDLEDLIRERI